MPDPDEVWIVVSSTGAVSAYDTRDAAINATRDTDDDVWIERAAIQGAQRPSEGPRSDERAPGDHPDTPTRHTGAQRITVPTSLGIPGWYDPWTGGNDAA